jgi:hypothetical protein
MKRRAQAVLPALLLALLASPALADGFIIVEPPRDRPRPPGGLFPLAVERHDVTVTIDGQVATTRVDQVFRNPLAERLEGLYEPLARGMRAALPYVDVFAGGYNLASLEEIAERLTKI